ncbi:MAG: glycosyltransferase family 4 protein [Candidatus Lokiarchaeota archaeon]|nr:glycosyltransferase family 4 protein [Candidatus Lokiarchaeota archaeon]
MNVIFVVNFNIYKKITKIKNIGGIETNTNDVISELLQRGHRVWVPERNPQEPEWVKKGEVDVVAASTFDPLTYLQVGKYKKRFKHRAALVRHAHTTVEDMVGNLLPDKPIFNKILELWLRIQYGPAHLLITPSNYSRQCLLGMQKSLTYPIHVVSNGIRIENFKEENALRQNFRRFLNEKFKVPPESTIILNVGLSWKKKGVDTFSEIARAFPDYYFVWVGPINKNPDIEEALKLKNVIFTGFYDDIREPYYGADVFLNTSRVENQGIPLIEAAICKLPIVAKDLPAYDWVENDVSCLKANETNEFIEAIEKITSNEQLRVKIANKAREIALEIHDFKKIGQKVEDLYKKAIRIKKIHDKLRARV